MLLPDAAAPAAAAGAGVAFAGGDLAVAGVSKRFGTTTVLENLSLSVAAGEFVSLLGPSGCGKTTLLRLVAGLAAADAGRITLGGQDITTMPAHRRRVGVVFQNYALFPHLNVFGNVAFGLRAHGIRQDMQARVADALRLVRMEAFATRAVSALSGGQQQRVAVARAIAVQPKLLLLDEPFSALDRKLRETMQVEMKQLLRRLGITAIFVTHDQEEALVMSDRVAVMNAGRIEQLDTPRALYEHPASLYVVDFIGQSARLSATVEAVEGGRLLRLASPVGTLLAPGRFVRGADVVATIRPEAIHLGAAPDGANQVRARVAELMFLGARTVLHCVVEGGAEEDRLMVELARLPDPAPTPGEVVSLWFRPEDVAVFPGPGPGL
jgi:putative spermidine/putrescine transport system ATP-binding protein